ncbi:Hint domain-containing protein [Gluconobacter frateurii]|uniref:Hint domain-containing protein n=1 Tax=Gluconobacter frateurii TaxID=38308 RepID=UPI001F06ABAB|nr:Hint domain-containing protein [Gluconobacter frateurii]UMM09127.1 Hint domain-containing protein [Gluconobacter frateurii]
MATTSSGSTFSGTVGPGQSQVALSGAKVVSATVSGSGAVLTVSSGASLTGTTVVAGGSIQLYAGSGSASGNIISSGGVLNVAPGAATSKDTIYSGGVVNYSSGSTVTSGGETVSYGGRVVLGYGAIVSGVGATISSGGTVEIINGVNYVNGATINVLEGGVVDFNAVQYSSGYTYSGVVSGNRLAAYVNGGFTAYVYLSTSAYSGQTFYGSKDPYDNGLDIIICYLAGTMIRMADGSERAVEDITIGDEVQTLVDGQVQTQAVTWAGAKKQVVQAGVPDDHAGYPVRVRAGALGDGVPYKDLLVTADHCLYLEGRFVPVRMLVNGASIDYDRSITEFTYYHIETERHSVIWADGALAESYLDTGNRRGFSQHGQIAVLKPRSTNWAEDAAAPLCVDREFVEPIYNRIVERCGNVVRATETVSDPALSLITNEGHNVEAIRHNGHQVMFLLPAGTTSVHMVSRASRPCDIVGPFVDDRRELGVQVRDISLWSGNKHTVIDTHLMHDHSGWHGREEGSRRWTNGNAFLPLPSRLTEETLLSVEVVAGGPYLEKAESPVLLKTA